MADGVALTVLEHTPTPLQLFRYSAVTWNPHRIHYEESYAASEGHPGILMHSHLRAAMAIRALMEAAGDSYRLGSIEYRVRKPVTPHTELTYIPAIVAETPDGASATVIEQLPTGDTGLEATATLLRAEKG